jgi:hypothetical protein
MESGLPEIDVLGQEEESLWDQLRRELLELPGRTAKSRLAGELAVHGLDLLRMATWVGVSEGEEERAEAEAALHDAVFDLSGYLRGVLAGLELAGPAQRPFLLQMRRLDEAYGPASDALLGESSDPLPASVAFVRLMLGVLGPHLEGWSLPAGFWEELEAEGR